MLGQKHQIARMQSDFYRDWYHKILRGVIFSTVIILGLMIAIIYYVLFQPPQTYYATTTEGQIIPLAAYRQ
jgi:hypothetical protein